MSDPNAWHEEEFDERVPVDTAGCERGAYERPAELYFGRDAVEVRVPNEPTQFARSTTPVDLADHGAETDDYLDEVAP